jgi:3-hydroxymyristoyl/3-hydroxydecanoyl-(acyl carrier protein) dehydratase
MAYETTAGFGSLAGVRVIEKTENSVTLEFIVPAESPYYDGHFPGFPILPAVAQVEFILRFADEYLETGIDVQEIRRIKFSSRVMPDKPHLLRLEKGGGNLSFKVFSAEEETVYSSGTLVTRGSGTQP